MLRAKEGRNVNDRKVLDMMLLCVSELAMEVAKCKNGAWHGGRSTVNLGPGGGNNSW